MDWGKKNILCTYLKLPFLLFSLSRLLSAANAQTETKKETRAGILAQFPSCLYRVTSLSPGTLRAAQLLTLWLNEGKCEQNAVENGREITKMNTFIFQEDSTANKN